MGLQLMERGQKWVKIILSNTLPWSMKISRGKCWPVPTTSAVQMLKRWSLITTGQHHSRRWGKFCRSNYIKLCMLALGSLHLALQYFMVLDLTGNEWRSWIIPCWRCLDGKNVGWYPPTLLYRCWGGGFLYSFGCRIPEGCANPAKKVIRVWHWASLVLSTAGHV